MEDTCDNAEYKYEHGLSVYIETDKHKILVDTGATGAFIENAKKLKINLEDVDTVVLSHGHYDHAGGIMEFTKINSKATIYMQKTAGDDYYHGERYIGINKKLLELPRVFMVDKSYKIDEELSLFANITGRKYFAESNLVLSKKIEGELFQDDFSHEQCLVIHQGEDNFLISGCAHNGILNILEKYSEFFGKYPKAVISGFHMMKKGDYTEEEKQVICDTAKELQKMNTIFYTGHCTGNRAVQLMKPIMKEKLKVIHSGDKLL